MDMLYSDLTTMTSSADTGSSTLHR